MIWLLLALMLMLSPALLAGIAYVLGMIVVRLLVVAGFVMAASAAVLFLI